MKLIPLALSAVFALSLGSAAFAEHEKNLVERVIDKITGEPTPAEKLVEAEEELEEATEEVQEANEETNEAVVEAAAVNVEVVEKAADEAKAKQALLEAKQRVEAAKAGIAATIKADAKTDVQPTAAAPSPAAKPAAKPAPEVTAAPAPAPAKAATPVASSVPKQEPVKKAAVAAKPKAPEKAAEPAPRFQLPAGTYQFMYDDGSHAYYYGSSHIVRAAQDRSYNAFEGDFRFGFGEMLFRRDGKEVSVRDNTGTYSFNGTGPIHYEPSAIWAIVMDDIKSGEFNTPRGTYTVLTDGRIVFRSTVQRDDIVIK